MIGKLKPSKTKRMIAMFWTNDCNGQHDYHLIMITLTITISESFPNSDWISRWSQRALALDGWITFKFLRQERSAASSYETRVQPASVCWLWYRRTADKTITWIEWWNWLVKWYVWFVIKDKIYHEEIMRIIRSFRKILDKSYQNDCTKSNQYHIQNRAARKHFAGRRCKCRAVMHSAIRHWLQCNQNDRLSGWWHKQ